MIERLLDNPAFTGLAGSLITAMIAAFAAIYIAKLNAKRDQVKQFQSIAIECAKVSHDAQVRMAEIYPDQQHVIKSMDYWIPYYIMLSRKLSNKIESSDDLMREMNTMPEIERALYSYVSKNSARQKQDS